VCLFISFGSYRLGARKIQDVKARKLLVSGFFVYFIIGTVVWFLDQMARGWIIFGWLTFFMLLFFTLGYGYFLVIKTET